MLKFLVLLFCSAAVYAVGPEAGENVAEVLSKGTDAIPISNEPPAYPRRALQDGVEGWVIVRFEINEAGHAQDIEVLETSIDDYFDRAALEAAKTRRYQPATLNGKPVKQGNTQARYVFMIQGRDGGVSRAFLRAYKSASDAITGQDLELANSLIEKLDNNKKRLLAEVCYLDMLKARYFTAAGNDEATLRHVRRALVIADDVATKEVYINLLKQAILEEGKANNYQASLEDYATLLEVDQGLAADDPAHRVADLVRQNLNGGASIVSNVEIAACRTCESPMAFSDRDLNRNSFFIDNLVGRVTEIKVRCRNGSISLEYQPETVWNIKKEWGECMLRVFGDEGTTLQLVEPPY
ncbi:MAG: energy transducer TonB [Xanthomonadales bacterium]|nr:energy transducer TonB [Xanthomonadales bacterium]